ncbi:DUF1697 domain-containing protein [Mesorhizobium sp. SB112]|uniref:DUF1697 domain-containing protein n=1 Tax=Mesorhizobium sp. SB112 TaxID=3151853 RepID=UPI003262EA22
MTSFIILFRGVGGATQLPTKPLREVLTEAGFGNVRTYINSGNAVLTSDKKAEEVERKIAVLTAKHFDFTKEIFVISSKDFDRMVEKNPFREETKEPTKLHLFVLKTEPEQAAIAALKGKVTETENLHIDAHALYFHTPKGFSDSKLGPKIDRILGVAITARNWNSVLKLQSMAHEAS